MLCRPVYATLRPWYFVCSSIQSQTPNFEEIHSLRAEIYISCYSIQKKRLPGAWIAHLVKFCHSKVINLTRSCPTFWLEKTLVGLITRNISAIENIFLFIIQGRRQLKTVKKKKNTQKTVIFHLSRAITLTRSGLTTLIPKTFVGLIIKIISAIERMWLNLTVLEI